jgi:hypothetical protein
MAISKRRRHASIAVVDDVVVMRTHKVVERRKTVLEEDQDVNTGLMQDTSRF